MSSVDVVVPCYNYARYLEQCVSSILDQDGVDVRVLIIDDASSDRSAEVGAGLAARDPRVTFRRHERNWGHIKTFNEGVIGWATAKYTLLISADDALAPGALARAAKIMDEHDDVGMTYGMAQVIVDDRDLPTAEAVKDFDFRIIPGQRYLQFSCEHGNGVPTPTAVIRTELQHRVGGYNPKMLHTSDMEMWMRLAARASIGVIRAVQGYYRWHGNNMTLGYVRGMHGDRRQRIFTCNEVLQTWGAEVDGIADWVAAMRQRYVGDACWYAGLAMERGDVEGERACLEFAKELQPALWRSPGWWRYLAKRCLGPRLSRRLRAAIGRPDDPAGAAGADPQASLPPEQQIWVSYQHGQGIGWWPHD